MLNCPNSRAVFFVNAITPPFAAAYALLLISLKPRPAIDAKLTTFPLPCSFMIGTTEFVKINMLFKLKFIIACHSSTVSSSTLADGLEIIVLPPTPLIKISMRLLFLIIFSSALSAAFGSRASIQ